LSLISLLKKTNWGPDLRNNEEENEDKVTGISDSEHENDSDREAEK
jgi:hypothetical protein